MDGGGVHRSLLVLFVLVVFVVPFVFVLFVVVFVVVFVVPFDLLPLGPSTPTIETTMFKKNNCQKYCSTNKNSTQSMSIDRIGKPTTQNKEKPKQPFTHSAQRTLYVVLHEGFAFFLTKFHKPGHNFGFVFVFRYALPPVDNDRGVVRNAAPFLLLGVPLFLVVGMLPPGKVKIVQTH